MTESGGPEGGPLRARRAPREDARPQTVLERQQSLSGYLVRRSQRRREAFLRRAATFTVSQELARAAYLVACIAFDLLVIPEAVLLVPGWPGWGIAAGAFAAAVWIQARVYVKHFALPREPASKP